MKRQAIVLMLAGLFFLAGCGGRDKEKDVNKGLDRPVPEQPPEKK